MTMTDKPEDRLLDLLKHMRTLPLVHPTFKESQLTPAQIALLGWISHSPGCGVQDIAEGLHLTPPTISVGINRLIQAGWVERRRNPQDLRLRPVYLTAEGESLIKQVKEHRYKMLQLFLSGLTREEQELLLDLLKRGVSAVEAALIEQQQS